MGRRPSNKPKIKEEKQLKSCTSCGVQKDSKQEFYLSNSPYDADRRLNICKSCLKNNIDYNNLQTVKTVLLQINRPFIYALWLSSMDEANAKVSPNSDLFGCYMKNLTLAYKDLTWSDSDESDPKKDTLAVTINSNVEILPQSDHIQVVDNRNKEDVIKMVGYDPFEFENESDKRHLYNKLVDFLDESTLEDSFKLPAVIEIVKTFNQIDKINNTISLIVSNSQNLADNVGQVKSLGDAKEKMLKSVLALAKDNGISVNHNNNKSKGSGTLTGIIKQLQEKGFQEADVNIFDIETSAGMSQVAEISNRSILNQLQFDENDYSEMLMEQREIITELREKVEKLEEENRLLKIKLKTVMDNEK